MLATFPIALSDLLAGFFYFSIAYVVGVLITATVETARSPQPWRSRDFNEVKAWLSSLLRRGYDGGSVVFTHKKTDRSIGFRKYIVNDGGYGLELFVPQPTSFSVSIPKLKDCCEELGFGWRETEESPVGQTSEVLLVDCARDVERAFDLAHRIWTGVFSLSTDTFYEREGSQISPHDELVDSRNHPKISDDEIRDEEYRRSAARIRRDYSMSINAFASCFILPSLSFLFSILALPIAALLSMNRSPDWVITLGEITFGGSTASLVLLLVYCLSLVAYRRTNKWLNLPKSQKSRTQRIFAAGFRVVVLGLPIAVILSWSGV